MRHLGTNNIINDNDKNINNIDNMYPVLQDIAPLAIGLFLVLVLFLSKFISLISLNMYIPLATKQKAIKTYIELIILKLEYSLKLSNKGKNINKFFTQ